MQKCSKILLLHSEEPLESNNKDIRHFREKHARKTSPENNLFDIFARSYRRSDPEILSIIIANRPPSFLSPLKKLPKVVLDMLK